jgi:Ca2+-transporting ATPase
MNRATPDASPAWHRLGIGETFARLESRAEGLASDEAARRLARYGFNEIGEARRVSAVRLLLAQFKSVLIFILLFAVGFSIYAGHTIEAVVIGVIVLLAVGLGFVQEYRAERAMEALQKLAAPMAAVLRDGELRDIPAHRLVPGDVVRLVAGNRVPADLRLIEAVNLQANEAALTGESVPVAKQTEALPAESLAVGDRRNLLYAGTDITYGRGRGVVVETGMNTEFGHIVRLLQSTEQTATPLQKSLDKVGNVLAFAALLIVSAVVMFGLGRGEPLHEMLLFGIALAVAVVPEALPAVVAISLAIGARRMVRRNALIRRLPAVETLGCTSVICSDKTGTLTKDEMTVRKLWVAGSTVSVTGVGYEPVGRLVSGGQRVPMAPHLSALLGAMSLANDAALQRVARNQWTVTGDPTEGALLVAAAKAGLRKSELDECFPRIGEVPFTPESKCMTTRHADPDGGEIAITKGALEVVLGFCTDWLTAAGEAPLAEAVRANIHREAEAMGKQALRVLAVAGRTGADAASARSELCFLGLAGMIDPPRPESKTAIATCEKAGIKVVMITGDHPVTAEAVARELGILKRGRVVTGADLDAMSEPQFKRSAGDVEVYARVSPEHKLRVVAALQAQNRVVAMTGDGVNDAPALRQADIGIAMGVAGTDVSREAADMMLTDDNFASIVAAVEEGRGIFNNIKKYLMYLLSSNIGEIGLMAGATFAGWPLPLSAVQILYVNLATDGLPALALAVDPLDDSLMRHPPRDPNRGIFTRPVVGLMLAGGLWSAAVNLGMFFWSLEEGRPLDEAMTLNFATLVTIEFFKAYNFRSDHRTVFHRPFANRWLNLAIGWELALLAALIYVPLLQQLFGTVPIAAADWLRIVGAAATIVPVLELAKWAIRLNWDALHEEQTLSA